MSSKNISLDSAIQRLAFHNHTIRSSDPERYEKNHFNLMAAGFYPETSDRLSGMTCMILSNYFKNWVYEDSCRNYAALISEEHGRIVVDHVHYEDEMKILYNLNNRLSYSAEFTYFLVTQAEKTIDELSCFDDLCSTDAIFPYLSIDHKLSYATEYAQRFTSSVRKKLGIDIPLPVIDYEDSEYALAFYTVLDNEQTGEKIPFIGITQLGIKLSMHKFTIILQHELVHHVVRCMGSAETEWEPDIIKPYHSFSEDVMLAYASGKNRSVTSAFYPDLYLEDKEEELCNMVGFMAGEYIERFTPRMQITHQPLPKI